MAGVQQVAVSRCSLCPAMCMVRMAPNGPDAWAVDYPQTDSPGLCARGAALGELMQHPRRIVSAGRREGTRTSELPLSAALDLIADRLAGGAVSVLIDANLPCEELADIARRLAAWPLCRWCFVLEPAEEQLVLGAEASGADYLAVEDLAKCDGFVIVGDAFAANPLCSRPVFDRRQAEPRTPIVAIDPAAGTAAKFATHRLTVEPGEELAALKSLAAAAGVREASSAKVEPSPLIRAAGKALAGCTRVGVLLAAEYARTPCWYQIGLLAGKLAAAKGGGLAIQTTGANALGALRLARGPNTVSLAQALADANTPVIAIGVDILGMLGWQDAPLGRNILAAAAALPNRTTQAAEVVLPLSMPGEMAGTYLPAGQAVQVVEAMPPPAGVPGAAKLVSQLVARVVGGDAIAGPMPSLSQRARPDPPLVIAACDPPAPMLLLARDARRSGCDALTGRASYQQAADEPVVRLSPRDASQRGIPNLAMVEVRSGKASARARVRIVAELPAGVMVMSEAHAASRRLAPSVIHESGLVVSAPASVELRP